MPILGGCLLRKAAQKHCCRDNVLASLSELWGIIPPIDDVKLNLTDVTPSAARRVTRTGRGVVR